jgi:hypothetical protein
MTSLRRLRAVIATNKNDHTALLQKGKAVHHGLSEHPSLFVTPIPALVVLLGKIQAYEQAQQLAETRVKGSIAARNAKAAEMVTALETLEGVEPCERRDGGGGGGAIPPDTARSTARVPAAATVCGRRRAPRAPPRARRRGFAEGRDLITARRGPSTATARRSSSRPRRSASTSPSSSTR